MTPPDTGLVAELLAATALTLLVKLVDAGKGEPESGPTRRLLAEWLSLAPMVCKQARDALASEAAYAAVLFYERTRLRLTHMHREVNCFFNGLPRSLPMFGAPVAIQFPVDRMRDLDYQDVLNERLHTVGKLDDFARDSPKLVELAQQFDHLTDLSTEVPMRVRIFISRTRSMCEGMRACKPAHFFRQCAHTQCNRLFMAKTTAPSTTPDEVACHVQANSTEYWDAIHPLPKYHSDARRFCSQACAKQWWDQLSGALMRTVDADGPGSCLPQLLGVPMYDLVRLVHEPAAQREFDFALKRNGQLKSAITKLHKKRKKWAPGVAWLDVDREARARLVRANVDLGVLHAAVKASSIKRWRERQRVPGDFWDWRNNGSAVDAAMRAKAIHDHHPADTPIDDLLKQHSFLNMCKQSTRAILKIS